jgi:imidazolonepropionase-like amidohydrolase
VNVRLRVAIAVLLAGTSLASGADGIAVVGATVVEGTGAPPLRDAIVVVRGERIVDVGPRSRVALPKGLRIVDGRGRWLIPGLVDAHVHFFQSGGAYTRPDIIDLRAHRPYAREVALTREALPRTFARYLASGVTSVADVGGPFWNFEVRDRARQSAMAPRVAVAGPLISTVARPELDLGDPPIVKVSGPEEARALVRRLAERQPDLVKVWFIFRPGDDLAAGKRVVEATVQEARAHGLRVAVHATELETARAAVEAGAAVLVHSVVDKPVDDAFVALLKEKHVVYTPTLFVVDGYNLVFSGTWSPTPAESRLGDPDVMATFDELKKLPEFPARPRRGPEADRVARENLKRLSDAGVTIAAGTDAGNIGTLHGPSLFRELRLMAEAGMTPAQVLAAATRGGALVMGREKELGTVEPGKLADLLLLDRDPLADTGNLEAVTDVVKGGRVFSPGELLRAAAAPR